MEACIGALLDVVALVVGILGGPLPLAAVPQALGAFFSFLGGWNLWSLRVGVRSAVVYQSGFAACAGARVSTWSWAEITSLVTKTRIESGSRVAWTTQIYDVSRRDGEKLVLDSYHFEDDDIGGLIQAIKERVEALLLPPLQAAYDAGQPVTFGAVTVSRDFIREAGQWPSGDHDPGRRVVQGARVEDPERRAARRAHRPEPFRDGARVLLRRAPERDQR